MAVKNTNITFPVCAAGYYRSQGACALCTGNTVKMASGDAVHCDDDDPCDGFVTVPNPEHTACGKCSNMPENHFTL